MGGFNKSPDQNFFETLEKVDTKLDSNKNGDIDSGENNYSEAVNKIKKQRRIISQYLKNNSDNEKILALQNNLNSHITTMTERLESDTSESFKQTANLLNSHWEGIFNTEPNGDSIGLDEFTSQFTVHEISSGDTLGAILQQEYSLKDWSSIESMLQQFFTKTGIKQGEKIILPNITELRELFNSQGYISHKDLVNYLETQTNIEPKALYKIFKEFKDGNQVEQINYNETSLSYNLSKNEYNKLVQDFPETRLKEIFGDAITQEERVQFIQEVIEKQSRKYESLSIFLEFIFSDEKQTFKNAEKQSDKAHLKKLSLLSQLQNQFGDTYQEKYSLLQKKENHIKSITELIITSALGGKEDFSASNIKESLKETMGNNFSEEIFEEIMDENNILGLVNKIVKVESPEERTKLVHNLVNIMSDQLRARSALFKRQLHKMDYDSLKGLAPKDVLNKINTKYQSFSKNPRSGKIDKKSFIKREIEEYFSKIEDGSSRNSQRISDYVEQNILGKRIPELEAEQTRINNEIGTVKISNILELSNPAEVNLIAILNDFGITDQSDIIEQFKQIRIHYGTSIMHNFESDISKEYDKANRSNSIIEAHGRINDRGVLCGKLALVNKSIKQALTSYQDRVTANNQTKGVTNRISSEIKEVIVQSVLQQGFIKSSVSNFADYHLNKETTTGNRDSNISNIKDKLLTHILGKSSDAEKDLFLTYANINGTFNDSISDSHVEKIVDMGVNISLLIASGGIAGTVVSGMRLQKFGKTASTVGSGTVDGLSYGSLSSQYNYLSRGVHHNDISHYFLGMGFATMKVAIRPISRIDPRYSVADRTTKRQKLSVSQ